MLFLMINIIIVLPWKFLIALHAKGMLWISGTQWKFSVSVVGQNEIQVKI